jgi:hypothetical protein
MTTLPATFVEAEAERFTRDWFGDVTKGSFLDTGYRTFDLEVTQVLLRRILRAYAEAHPLNVTKVVHWAINGLDEADDVLRELIAERVEYHEPLGADLGAYNKRLIHPDGLHRRSGRSKVPFLLQDVVIAVAVLQLIERFPSLKASRFLGGGSKKARACACSIVAKVMMELRLHRGGEDSVRKIWDRLKPVILPGYQWPDWGRGAAA